MEKGIKKNIIINTLYQILTMIIPFITTPYISRVIGSEGIGIYSYTNSIQMYFSMFAALGTASYGVREIARNRNDVKQRSKLFWEIEFLTILTTIACLIAWGILIIFSSDYKIYYIVLTMNLLNTMFDISWFYAGLEEFKYTVMQNSIFKILGVVLLFIFVKGPNDLAIYIGIMSLTSLLGTMSMWVYLPKFIKKVDFKTIRIKNHFKETLVYFIPTIATSIYTVLDKTLLGIITQNASENGYYEQATKIINITKAITFASLNSVMGSRISYLFVEKKYDEIRNKINESINFILFFGFGIMFGLLAVSDTFVPLFFGQGYDKVIYIIKLMSPLVLIIGVSNCLGSLYYSPAGYRAQSAKYLIVGSVVNLIFNLIFIPKWSSYGATIATIIAEFVITILYFRNCDGYLKLNNFLRFTLKKMFAAIIMLISIYYFKFLNISSFVIVCLQVLVGVIVYVISLLLLKDEYILKIYNSLINDKIKRKKATNNE